AELVGCELLPVDAPKGQLVDSLRTAAPCPAPNSLVARRIGVRNNGCPAIANDAVFHVVGIARCTIRITRGIQVTVGVRAFSALPVGSRVIGYVQCRSRSR